MADGALLLVDAAEGPLPQTRFVLRKCLELGFPVIVVINKIDRSDARADEVLSEVFDLFCDLEATDAQTRLPDALRRREVRHGEARARARRQRTSCRSSRRSSRRSPRRAGDAAAPLQILVSNLDHDDYVGRLAIGRVVRGTVQANQPVA